MQSLATFISTPKLHVKCDASNQLTDSSIPLLSSISKMKDSDGHQLTDLPLSNRSDNNARVATLIPFPKLQAKCDASNHLTDSSFPFPCSLSKMKYYDGNQSTDLPLSIPSNLNPCVAPFIPTPEL